MKILYVCKTLPYAFKGGIQTHVWKLSEWMLRRGHEVYILTAGSWKNKVQIDNIDGRQVISLPYFPGRRLPIVGAMMEEMSFNKAAAKWLFTNQNQFDLIHLQGRSGNLFLAHPDKITVPVINTLHGFTGIEHDKKGRVKGESFVQKKHIQWAHEMEERALENADKLIAVSQEMRRELVERRPDCEEKNIIIPNGIDAVEMKIEVATNPDLLVFVGRLDAIKGIFPLVEAMKKVKSNIELVMIGDGAERPALEKAIQAAGLKKRIHLQGSLDAPQVFGWIRKSYALILPSFHETQGIVLMEANSCGKPVLASDINGINEVVVQGKNGLLFQVNHPEKMANAINFLFDNPDLASEMGEWGKTYVQDKFSWETIAEKTEQVYQNCLKPATKVTDKFVKNV